MRPIRQTVIAAVVAVVVAGCTGDDAEVTEPEEADVATTVAVREFAFQDPSVIVAPDSTVTWENQDSADHTVTSGTPEEPTGVFDEELPAEGEVTITMVEPGTYPYYCRIHPDMAAEVVVEPGVD